jgi:hypothetical protein
MTDNVSSQYATAGRTQETSGAAVGFIAFAAMIMFMAGGFQIIAGLVAIFTNEFYVATPRYLLQFDVTSWGWIHLLVGLILVGAGSGLLSGRTWARVVGVTLAILSALANFAFIPYYPIWSLIIITLNVFIIWALVAHGRDIAIATTADPR